MIRWAEKFSTLDKQQSGFNEKTHEYFDMMYACFQNIFFLKDWLKNDTIISKNDLEEFINGNKEIGVCRDICNGTKHYNITNSSIDSEFGIIKQYNPHHKIWDQSEWEIIICAGGSIFKPRELIKTCIDLWDEFISEKLNLEKGVKTNN